MFLFEFLFLCVFVKQQHGILQEISPQPSFQHPTLENGLDPRLQLIDTCSCEPMVFPGVRASVGVPAGYWSPYFRQVFFLMHNLSY